MKTRYRNIKEISGTAVGTRLKRDLNQGLTLGGGLCVGTWLPEALTWFGVFFQNLGEGKA